MHTIAHAKKAAFIAAFQECGTVRGASRASDVSTRSHYRWLADDPEYATAIDEAGRFAAAHLVDVARERAIEGVRKYKFDRSGQPIIDPRTGEQYYDLTYSDTCLIFLLKGLMPERFGDRQTITHDAADWRQQLADQGVDPDQALAQVKASLEQYEPLD